MFTDPALKDEAAEGARVRTYLASAVSSAPACVKCRRSFRSPTNGGGQAFVRNRDRTVALQASGGVLCRPRMYRTHQRRGYRGVKPPAKRAERPRAGNGGSFTPPVCVSSC